jgi:uncharacterized protein (DUF362 family)
MRIDRRTVALAHLPELGHYPSVESLLHRGKQTGLCCGSPIPGPSSGSLVSGLFREAGFDERRAGLAGWNPLGEFVRPGDSVLLKPNFVNHQNHSSQGMDCMVTHPSVLASALDYVLLAQPGRVIVGDAPMQSCDLKELMDVTGYAQLKEHYARLGALVEWVDFRRTILDGATLVAHPITDRRPVELYTLFDLGSESLLEPLSMHADRFRVTMYDPALMRHTHARGRHQYLIAREALEADVVLNLPKLKTHKKAGITGALKNLVGLNGNKDYLPHHRLGGRERGGDCYFGGSRLKMAAERLLDCANGCSGISQLCCRQAARVSIGLARLLGEDSNVEGSWHGNDTVWRTCLDLNRILVYGRPDGSLAPTPQRRILTITDAVICGEGEGPLAPSPKSVGLLTCSVNQAAADLVHAHLMGFDWRNIPLVREAFTCPHYPLVDFCPEDVQVLFEGRRFKQPWPLWNPVPFRPPAGWVGHCERVCSEEAQAGYIEPRYE